MPSPNIPRSRHVLFWRFKGHPSTATRYSDQISVHFWGKISSIGTEGARAHNATTTDPQDPHNLPLDDLESCEQGKAGHHSDIQQPSKTANTRELTDGIERKRFPSPEISPDTMISSQEWDDLSVLETRGGNKARSWAGVLSDETENVPGEAYYDPMQLLHDRTDVRIRWKSSASR